LDTKELANNEKKTRQKIRHASEVLPIDPMDETKLIPEAARAAELPDSQEQLRDIKSPVLDYQEIHRSLGYKKDPKSLTQSLFDTHSVKSYEWQTILSPMDILRAPSMRGNGTQDQKSNGHPVSNCNGGTVKTTEKMDRKAMGHDDKESIESQPFTKPAQMNGNAVPTSYIQNSNENVAERENYLPGTIGTISWRQAKRMASTDVAVVAQLTGDTICGLRSLASQTKGNVGFNHTGNYSYSDPPSIPVGAATRPLLLEFVKRTLVYHFADLYRLSRLIQQNKSPIASSNLPISITQHFATDQNVGLNVACFTKWVPVVGPLLLDSFWQSLEGLFVPPPNIVSKVGYDKTSHSSSTEKARYIHDVEAADIVYLAILALVGSGYSLHDKSQETISDLRAWGRTLPNSHQSGSPDPLSDPWLDISDHFEYEPAVRLAKRLVRVIAARRSFWHISKMMPGGCAPRGFPLMRTVISYMKNEMIIDQLANRQGTKSSGVPFYLLEWLRTIILKTWDGEATVKRWEGTGAAIEIISDLCMLP
jgi:hypothetical protein